MAELVFRCKQYAPENDGGAVLFFVAAFKSKAWWYDPVIRLLNRHGFKVYVYDYQSEPLLDAQPEQWVEFSHHINADIAAKIAAERRQREDVRFGIIGASVGSALALHAAKVNPEIERMMFVTIFGSMAYQVWEHPILLKMKSKFESRGVDFPAAGKSFGPLEPLSRLQKLGKRPALVFASEHDPVILWSNTQLLLDAARRQRLDFTVGMVRSRRHSLTIVNLFRHSSRWLPFFAELLDGTAAVKTVKPRSRLMMLKGVTR